MTVYADFQWQPARTVYSGCGITVRRRENVKSAGDKLEVVLRWHDCPLREQLVHELVEAIRRPTPRRVDEMLEYPPTPAELLPPESKLESARVQCADLAGIDELGFVIDAGDVVRVVTGVDPAGKSVRRQLTGLSLEIWFSNPRLAKALFDARRHEMTLDELDWADDLHAMIATGNAK